MKTKLIEATDGTFWGKFLLGRMDEEFGRRSVVDPECRIPLVRICGHDYDRHLWVLDLETREGACFTPGGLAAADLRKHPIRVCPLFAPFLAWLYQQNLADIHALPDCVKLPPEHI